MTRPTSITDTSAREHHRHEHHQHERARGYIGNSDGGNSNFKTNDASIASTIT